MKKIYQSIFLAFAVVSYAQTLTLVKDIRPGTAASSAINFAVYNNKMFFSANDGTSGAELWTSDGTAAGTQRVEDFNAGSGSFSPANLKSFAGKLFFSGGVSAMPSGAELYTYTESDGIQLFADIKPGSASSSPSLLSPLSGLLYFKATEPASTNPRLYATDGTNPPVMVDPAFIVSNSMIPFNGKLIIYGGYDTSDMEPYIFDGTTFTLLKNIRGTGSSNVSNLFYSTTQNLVYFTARSDESGTEPWVTDGTPVGTRLLKDINQTGADPSLSNSSVSDITEYNGKVFFGANDGTGSELWESDGTTAGTKLFKDINPGAAGSNPGIFTHHNGLLYFLANDAVAGRELFVTDGTVGNTKMVADFNPGSSGSTISDITSINGELYLMANVDSSVGKELYKVNFPTLSTTQDMKQSFRVFPNPCYGILKVTVKDNLPYKIFDLSGKLLKEGFVKNQEINTGLKPGIYLLKVEAPEGTNSTKIIIK